jgi:hypothetical protein
VTTLVPGAAAFCSSQASASPSYTLRSGAVTTGRPSMPSIALVLPDVFAFFERAR